MENDSKAKTGKPKAKAGNPSVGQKPAFLGVSEGVSVQEMESQGLTSYAVTFPFDHYLSNMLRAVPGAEFVDKQYKVPLASVEQLGKAVDAMRVEAKAISSDLDNIKELAWKSGTKAQLGEGAASGVLPQVSLFHETGKVYRGDIVNANSRFVAQLVGFGKQDGAAFVTIHRLADLDRGDIMKGESLAITYDNKLFGAVSGFTKHKPVAELEAEFTSNLGKAIDGVTVTERGSKIGVAFELNPVLYSRIKRLEGAAFNVTDKVWEVPLEKKEFVLFAVEDMRNEFVVDSKEVSVMRERAEEKIDGAKVWNAFTKDGQQHFGNVLAVGERYALQSTGRGNFTLHHLSMLDTLPVVGQNMAIRYNKGVGAVANQGQGQALDAGR